MPSILSWPVVDIHFCCGGRRLFRQRVLGSREHRPLLFPAKRDVGDGIDGGDRHVDLLRAIQDGLNDSWCQSVRCNNSLDRANPIP